MNELTGPELPTGEGAGAGDEPDDPAESYAGHCKACRSWEYLGEDTSLESEYGRCRRHPPVVVAGQVRREHDWDQAIDGVWPTTHDFDWCGEYRAKEDKGDA